MTPDHIDFMFGIIEIILGVTMLYCFGMWLYCFYKARTDAAYQTAKMAEIMAEFTFRVGLCGILAAGFLGLLLK